LALCGIILAHDVLDFSRSQELAGLAEGRPQVLRADHAAMVRVEVAKESLDHLSTQQLLHLNGCDEKFSVVDLVVPRGI